MESTLTLNIPRLEFPIASMISPFTDRVQEHTMHWAENFNLVSSEKLRGFTKAKFGWYAAREYPNAEYQELCIVGDLITWLFTVDDQCDRASSNGIETTALKAMLQGFISVLSTGKAAISSQLNISLLDIINRLEPISSPYLFSLFIKEMISYFQECLWEIDMQAENYMPSIQEYLNWRPKTGFYIMFPLVSIFDNLDLPAEVYEHEIIKRIELLLNLTANLANDLHSLEREMELNTKGLNLVFIYQNELKISLENAIAMVSEQYAENLITLEQCRKNLPFWNDRITEQINTYIDGLYIAIKAYFDWAIVDTARYKKQ